MGSPKERCRESIRNPAHQAQAIARAKELAPDRRPHVERSEYTNKGKPGKFRK